MLDVQLTTYITIALIIVSADFLNAHNKTASNKKAEGINLRLSNQDRKSVGLHHAALLIVTN
ncbi:hypothetical protein DS893_14975 [Vibrionales bacterium C3R12]|nr:hypothetical protein DS893_14975 [Vibrionales bacterium C3R12]